MKYARVDTWQYQASVMAMRPEPSSAHFHQHEADSLTSISLIHSVIYRRRSGLIQEDYALKAFALEIRTVKQPWVYTRLQILFPR